MEGPRGNFIKKEISGFKFQTIFLIESTFFQAEILEETIRYIDSLHQQLLERIQCNGLPSKLRGREHCVCGRAGNVTELACRKQKLDSVYFRGKGPCTQFAAEKNSVTIKLQFAISPFFTFSRYEKISSFLITFLTETLAIHGNFSFLLIVKN